MHPLTALLMFAGLPGCSDAGVTKFNTDPTSKISSHADGDTVREGYAEILRGTVGDANHGIDQLSVTWLVDGTEVCPESLPDAEGLVTCDHTFLPTGGEVVLEVRDPEGGSGNARVTLDVQPTDAPLAEITAPTTDGVYYSDQLTTLAGVVDDGEDAADVLTVTWASSADGDLLGGFNEPDSEGGLPGAVTLTEGDHFLTLTVTDSTGKEGRDSTTIQVGPPNSSPTCEITAPSTGDAGSEGELVTFTAEVGDVDVSADWLTVTWNSDKDGPLGDSAPNSAGGVTFPYAGLTTDTHVVTMTVADEVGGTCAADVVYTVGTPPELMVTSPVDGDLLNETDSVSFTATVRDNEDLSTNIALSWSSDVDGEFSTQGADSSGAISFSVDTLSPGAHALSVRATDTDGLFVQTNLDITINQVPTAPTVSLSPDPAYTASTLTAAASGSTDPDGSGTVTYSYAWYEDGIASSVSTTATFPSSDTQKDSTYRVVVTPSDGTGDGPTGEAERTIDNTAPVLTGPTLSASAAQVGETLTCAATATDADAVDTPTVSYAWQDGSTVATYTVTDADAPSSTLTCTATADDGDGGTDSASASATITNTDPVMGTVSVSPSTGQVGDVLTCSASASDADAGTPTLSYAWPDGSTAATYTIVDSDDPGDVITCTATATDTDLGTDTGTASATVTNTDPELSTVSISPSTANNDDTLTCSATATDADGATPTISYAWSGSTSGSLGSGSSIDLSTTAAGSGETITCTATATDGDLGTDIGTATRDLDNRDPTVSVTLSPSSGAIWSDTLTCTATVADDDDDSLTTNFTWTVGGTTVSASSTASLSSTLASIFVAGNLVACTATTDDGKGGTDTDTASTTITNTAPVVSTPSLSPATAYTNDTLTATVTTSDAEGDSLTVTYDWNVGGASVQDSTDNTLSGASYFDKDQVVFVIVTADDGTDTTSVTSSTVTVSNTAPTAPVVTIDPSEPVEGEDLFCDVTTASTDDDGDPITYSMSWTYDTAAYSGALTTTWNDDTADGADTVADEVWECTATPNDGNDDGGTGTDSVTVEDSCQAREFTSTSYVAVGAVSALTIPGSEFTVDFWAKPAGGGTLNQAVSTVTNSSNGWVVGIYGSSGWTAVHRTSGTVLQADVGTDAETEQWQHVAAEFSETSGGVSVELYVDGVQSASASVTGVTLTQDPSSYLMIANQNEPGEGAPGATRQFNGMLSQVRISSGIRYGTDFTPDATPSVDSDTLGLWRLADSALASALDVSGGGNDGVGTGGTIVSECPGADSDADGYLAWEDCDDTDASIYPFAGDTYGDSIDSDCDGLDCEADRSGTTYFAVCPGSQSKADSEANCLTGGYDGLAAITSATEDTDIVTLHSQTGVTASDRYWIGYTDAATEGTWVWDTGSSATYTNWLSSEPNGGTSENCTLTVATSGWGWGDFNCSATTDSSKGRPLGAVCEAR